MNKKFQSRASMMIVLLALIGGSATFSGAVLSGPASKLYDIATFAIVPASPGFPEGITIHGNRIFVSGPARFGTAGTGPSTIEVYNRITAEHVQTIQVAGEVLEYEHALSNAAVDNDGSIYVLSTQLGLIRFDKQDDNYVQHAYGDPLPDLPCSANTNAVCPPPEVVIPPIPNDVVFDSAGYAYVTDSLQQTIFRYAPGGGVPEIWLQSPMFEGGGFLPFGLNGMRLDSMREHLYFAVTSTFNNPYSGIIYRVPLVDTPTEADVEQFYVYSNGEAPDQLAFGANGKLYVSLALSNQISILNSDGSEETRINSSAEDDIPLDAPAGIAFDSISKSLMIANHALLSGEVTHFAILKAYVNDPGNPLEKPTLP